VGPHLSSYFFLSLFFLHRFFLLFFPQKVVAGVGGPAGYLSVLPVCRSVLKEGGAILGTVSDNEGHRPRRAGSALWPDDP
jgi:hypothetical protein